MSCLLWVQSLIYKDFGGRSRYLSCGWVIASHSVLWDANTHPCLIYLLLVPKFSYVPFYCFIQYYCCFCCCCCCFCCCCFGVVWVFLEGMGVGPSQVMRHYICSSIGLSPIRHQAITWINAELLSSERTGTKLILFIPQWFNITSMYSKRISFYWSIR